MSKLDEILRLAKEESHNGCVGLWTNTVEQLVALIRLQHEALKCEGIGGFSAEALAAFERLDKGE